jgi:hypothetical protein
VAVLQFWFSLLIVKLMFKGVSQRMPTVGVLYFGLFNLFKNSPLSLYLPPPVFQQLSIYILISSAFTSYGMWYYWCSIILYYFKSSLWFKSSVTEEWLGSDRVCRRWETWLFVNKMILCIVFSFMYVPKEIKGTRPLHCITKQNKVVNW